MLRLSVSALVVLAARAALAALTVGGPVPTVSFEDTNKNKITLPSAMNTLIFYEDKDAGEQNEPTRKVVGPITDNPQNRSLLVFMAIADLDKWNWFPAHQYALKEMARIARVENTTLYCDWRGIVRKAWGLTKGKSGVILLDGQGRVRFFGEGPLSPAQRDELVRQLAALGIKT